MGLEIIIGLVVAVLVAMAGSFGFGQARGTSKAEAKADKQRIEENAIANVAAAERRVETTKEACDVQETVRRMGDDDVDRKLRSNWTRKG